MKSLGSPFDFNRDGKLDSIEQAVEMQFMFDHIFTDDDSEKREKLEVVLEEMGLTMEDLEEMDEEEVRKIIDSIG